MKPGFAADGLPVVGMVGGGQLARMTHQAGIALGLSLRVLATTADESAARVATDVRLGAHTDLAALQAFAEGCHAVTFDHEHVPQEHVRALEAAGIACYPPADALRFAQDKAAMRERLGELGVPIPRWAPVRDVADVVAFAAEAGWPVVLKATRGGYDGRGVWVVADADDAGDVVDTGAPLLVEELVDLRRELAALVARSPFGQGATWPVVETVQRDGICHEVIAPAPDLDPDVAVAAEELALKLAGELGVVGVLAVELFETTDGRLLVNELAMRPHNSGHWTIDGAVTSQFEQHLRAVCDYPLGETTPVARWTVMANVLGGDGEPELDKRLHQALAADPGLKVHLYGKEVRPGRKIGHVTVVGDDLDTVRRRAVAGARMLREGAR